MTSDQPSTSLSGDLGEGDQIRDSQGRTRDPLEISFAGFH